MYGCMYVCVCTIISSYYLLELKLFNTFCQCTFKRIVFVAEVLEFMNKIFQEYFLDDPVFRLVAILKYIKNFSKDNFKGIHSEIYKFFFEKTTSKKSIFKVSSYSLSTKSFKNTFKEISILESCSVSVNKTYKIHLGRKTFSSSQYSWLYL